MARSSTSTQIITDDSVVLVLKREDFNVLNDLLYVLQDADALRALSREHSWGLGANNAETVTKLWKIFTVSRNPFFPKAPHLRERWGAFA